MNNLLPRAIYSIRHLLDTTEWNNACKQAQSGTSLHLENNISPTHVKIKVYEGRVHAKIHTVVTRCKEYKSRNKSSSCSSPLTPANASGSSIFHFVKYSCGSTTVFVGGELRGS